MSSAFRFLAFIKSSRKFFDGFILHLHTHLRIVMILTILQSGGFYMKKSIFIILFTLLFTLIAASTPFPYMAAAEDAPTSAGVVRTYNSALNVRSKASTQSTVVGSLKKDSYVSLLGRSGDFYKVLYAPGKLGFCHSDYIETFSGSYGAFVNTASTSLNVRSGPSVSYGILASLYKGERIVVLSTHGGFYKILYRGTKVGYASAAYIKKSVAQNEISLNVPSFKQYDSRWSSVRLGNSYKTIYQSGCLTTAIAMENSYYLGYTVTPAYVAKNSTYTSGGAIYWPSYYNFITGSGYLNTILSLLKQGVPVLVGATNKHGGQHWVIVTGYKANGNISADDFTIHDPGSSSRSTLYDFFIAYPYFYKAAYRK